jgi:hypothetical protein
VPTNVPPPIEDHGARNVSGSIFDDVANRKGEDEARSDGHVAASHCRAVRAPTSESGTKHRFLNVRCSVANGGIADIASARSKRRE